MTKVVISNRYQSQTQQNLLRIAGIKEIGEKIKPKNGDRIYGQVGAVYFNQLAQGLNEDGTIPPLGCPNCGGGTTPPDPDSIPDYAPPPTPTSHSHQLFYFYGRVNPLAFRDVEMIPEYTNANPMPDTSFVIGVVGLPIDLCQTLHNLTFNHYVKKLPYYHQRYNMDSLTTVAGGGEISAISIDNEKCQGREFTGSLVYFSMSGICKQGGYTTQYQAKYNPNYNPNNTERYITFNALSFQWRAADHPCASDPRKITLQKTVIFNNKEFENPFNADGSVKYGYSHLWELPTIQAA